MISGFPKLGTELVLVKGSKHANSKHGGSKKGDKKDGSKKNSSKNHASNFGGQTPRSLVVI